MTATATVRVMSPEEIAARAGGDVPFLVWPQRQTVFAERAMRLRQLSRSHPMGEFLGFMADLAQAQQDAVATMPSVILPGVSEIDKAARLGVPPLGATEWPRDPAWHGVLRRLAQAVQPNAPSAFNEAVAELLAADADEWERQADALLHGVMDKIRMATAPLVASALQVYFTHLVLSVQERHGAGGQPFGRIDDASVCPCCGSRPTVSLIRSGGEFLGQRYLHCSVCSTQWHRVRAQCTHCGSSAKLAYQSLDRNDADADEDGSSRAAKAAIQAETCEDCGHYLKVIHSDRDPMAEPVTDDLASLTLDLLVSEAGFERHGVNLMLLFGADPENT